MKLFIDTANVDDIRKANDMGVICGVTTNPSLIAKEGRDFGEVIKEITTIVDGGVQNAVATGSFGIGFSTFLQSTLLIIRRKRSPKSIRLISMEREGRI